MTRPPKNVSGAGACGNPGPLPGSAAKRVAQGISRSECCCDATGPKYNVGENGECWIPADLVRYSDPVIPLVLWPLTILGALMFVLVIDSTWAKNGES
jgi:hypothetical protein